MDTVEWLEDDLFRIGRVTFRTSMDERFRSSSGHFLLVKHRPMLEKYEALLSSLRPERIVELGIYKGGSTAFIALLAQPRRMVALDLDADPSTGLERFIDEQGLRDRLHVHYSFDQADDPRMRAMILDEFEGDPLDLVVDDASHRVEPTRSSFNVLFPLLREGGVYVIEDWSGLHHLDAALQALAEAGDPLTEVTERLQSGPPPTPLSVVLFELVLASAYAPDVFAEMFVTDNLAWVVRGRGIVDPHTFDLSRVYSDAARKLLARTT